jgi:hypothetical protein
MLFKRITPDLPESVFVVVRNNEGGAMVAGQAVQLDVSTAVDGVKAVQPNTNELFATMGVADSAIADQDMGLVQVYGYRSSAVVFQTNTAQTAGVPLVPTAGQNYLASVATTVSSNANVTLQPMIAVLGESVASSAASATIAAKVFIKGLGL